MNVMFLAICLYWIYLLLYAAKKHGTPYDGNYNFWNLLFWVIVILLSTYLAILEGF